jgi:hypothetical protein
MRLTKQCYGCKEQFRKTELVDYASPAAKTLHSYCPKCLKEKQERELFANKICILFGIKSPGPLIWTQRKHLQETYGYTDDEIISCLDYLVQVEKKYILKETLGLVAPWSMEKMRQWKRKLAEQASAIAAAIKSTVTKEYIVPIEENIGEKNITNLEDGLFDD